MHILLVEGNKKHGERIKEKLIGFGHKVAHAFTFDGAQLLFETDTFDMIIIELATPEESILQFLNYLREIKSETPVYALTAEYAVSAAFKDLKFDLVDVMNGPSDRTPAQMSQKSSKPLRHVIQPKIFHNFCLN